MFELMFVVALSLFALYTLKSLKRPKRKARKSSGVSPFEHWFGSTLYGLICYHLTPVTGEVTAEYEQTQAEQQALDDLLQRYRLSGCKVR